jgi:PAS domain S-box-containing protein
LEAAVKLISNPIVLRMALVLFAGVFSFVMATMIIRRMRKSFTAHESPVGTVSMEQLPLQMYNAVIQQLKQQKHELLAQQQAEHSRARTSENVSAAILSNLSSGVVFFGANGLVRQTNPAAKTILGIGAASGMDADSLFRGASLVAPPAGVSASVGENLSRALQEGHALKRAEVYYRTPAGDPRVLELTISRVAGRDGGVLGAACVIDDRSQIAQIRQQMELRGELSAEMALALRTSLVTISGYAQQLAKNNDPEFAQQLASDIATEASHLDHTIGGFLAGRDAGKAAAGGI